MTDETFSRRELLTGRILPSSESAEIHLSSLVVHILPHNVDTVIKALEAMSGVEIHGRSVGGKIIVTLETATEHDVVQRLGAIGELPGVLSTALVYHHFEPSSGPA